MHILNPILAANFHFPVLGPQLTSLVPYFETVFIFLSWIAMLCMI